MREKRSLLNFAILFVVAAAVTIFVLRKAGQAVAEIEALNELPAYRAEHESTGPPESSAETTGTSLWRAYRNEKYGFAVRYPSNLKAEFTEDFKPTPYEAKLNIWADNHYR